MCVGASTQLCQNCILTVYTIEKKRKKDRPKLITTIYSVFKWTVLETAGEIYIFDFGSCGRCIPIRSAPSVHVYAVHCTYFAMQGIFLCIFLWLGVGCGSQTMETNWREWMKCIRKNGACKKGNDARMNGRTNRTIGISADSAWCRMLNIVYFCEEAKRGKIVIATHFASGLPSNAKMQKKRKRKKILARDTHFDFLKNFAKKKKSPVDLVKWWCGGAGVKRKPLWLHEA